jgi:antitoxin ParD1/3/4
MSVKASVSISEQQDGFARKLVEEGRYSSLSAVVQRGLELLREETELKDAELTALRALLDRRAEGKFVTMEESHRRVEAMIEAKRKSYGL